MDLFSLCPPEYIIDETWMPRPTISGTVLGPHCAEFIAREFGRCSSTLRVAVARLGRLTAELGAEEQRAVAALVDLMGAVEGEEHWADGNNVTGKFFAAADDVLSFRVTHLEIGHCPRGTMPEGTGIDNLPYGAVSRATAPSGDAALLLGGRGMLGPHVVTVLREAGRTVKVTDGPAPAAGDGAEDSGASWGAAKQMEMLDDNIVDICQGLQVLIAARGTDVIVNCAVNRVDRDLAFHVNCAGTYFALLAALAQGHTRFINTGPMTVVEGGDEATGTHFHVKEEGPLQVRLAAVVGRRFSCALTTLIFALTILFFQGSVSV
jgi:hypothetical protein